MLLLGGCDSAKRHAQEECFYRMMLMSGAGVSYLLEHRLSATNTITLGALANYLKPDGVACPHTQLKYEDFNLVEGPKCPEHGKAFDVYSSALADKDHPCRARALPLIGYSPKDPWNRQHSTALIAGLISVVKEEEGKPRADAATTLQRVTRQNFGEDARAWEAWWKTNKSTFQFKHPN
ncbi:MAG TPA: hypothetical protein VJW76_17010 [Verrucomicrobiae bacterium]|nr:hypothetical protein [Verrucomicrobiae bacterium]